MNRRRPTLLAVALVALSIPAMLFGLSRDQRWDDWDDCRSWSVPVAADAEPEYHRRAVDLCVEGRRAYRSGLFGLWSNRESRAAGRCGALWAAVEIPPRASPWFLDAPGRYGITVPLSPTPADRERFMDACVPARTAELRARGSGD